MPGIKEVIGRPGAQGVARWLWVQEAEYRRFRRLSGDQGFEKSSGGRGTRWWVGDWGLEVEARCSGRCQGAKAQEVVGGQ